MKASILIIDTELYQKKETGTLSLQVQKILEQAGYSIEFHRAIPKDFEVVRDIVATLADSEMAELIVTIGGTGCTGADCVPEATRAAVARELPGIGEAYRIHALRTEKEAMLYRGTAGIRNNSVVVNLPENSRMTRENLEYILPQLTEAVVQAAVSEETWMYEW